MPFFETIPVRKEARQYVDLVGCIENLIEWSEGAVFVSPVGLGVQIKTLEGTSYYLPKGHWVIKGVNGEFYPCDPDVFAKSYKEVD
jgi:hypothetical protein